MDTLAKIDGGTLIEPKYCPNCGMQFTVELLVKSFTGLIFNHNEKNEITVPAKGWGLNVLIVSGLEKSYPINKIQSSINGVLL